MTRLTRAGRPFAHKYAGTSVPRRFPDGLGCSADGTNPIKASGRAAPGTYSNYFESIRRNQPLKKLVPFPPARVFRIGWRGCAHDGPGTAGAISPGRGA